MDVKDLKGQIVKYEGWSYYADLRAQLEEEKKKYQEAWGALSRATKTFEKFKEHKGCMLYNRAAILNSHAAKWQ